MYAAHYGGAGQIGYVQVDPAPLGPDDVRIAVSYTGICGTDLHILHGDMDTRVDMPAAIGHEMAGRIAAVGEAVQGWCVGDAVSVMPLQWCGQCPACQAGHAHICHHLTFMGIDSPGALQNEWTVPAATLIRLPAGMDLRTAALLEPVAVATHDVARSRLRPDEHVLIVGGGPIGALIAFLASRRGAHVLVSEPDADRRALIAALGVEVVDPRAEDLAARVLERTDGAGVAVAFEVSGAAAGLDAAVANLATRGRLVLVAIHPQPRSVDVFRFFWRELELIGARVYERADFEAAAALLAEASDALSPLITAVYPLAEAAAAFERLAAGSGVMKVLVDCRPAEVAR
ncbi:MAG: alcohol dehydrogenase catalytic domain-containing protein [Phycicoccus sp.]|nr:alcohol dehydrogenase catalytic domain-containing protein [Phycicoccus sp.]